MKAIDRFRKIYGTILQGFIAVALFLLIVVNTYQLILRYAMKSSLFWVEDFSVLMLLSMAACGFGWLWNTHKMLSMDVSNYFLPKSVLHVLDYALEIFGLAIGPYLVYIGIVTYIANAGFVVSMTGFDEKIRYIPLIVSGFFITVSALLRLCELICADRKIKKGA